MENERNYFNDILAPRLSRLCSSRGVSFFSVDLRWGITAEDQINGQVLPICLSEIDKCRPFFIGILGNRYGTTMETVPANAASRIPWLLGKEGKSITELEMLYAVLDTQLNHGSQNCAFYLRSDQLSADWYGHSPEDPRLDALKQRIRSDSSIPCSDYGDLISFGNAVTRDITAWLDREFPLSEDVKHVRRTWYDHELLRNHIADTSMQQFLENYFQKTNRSLMIYGDGARGKTTFLTSWKNAKGKKILINCGSDDDFLYWPSVARQIIHELHEIDESLGFPDLAASASMMFQLMQHAHDHQHSASHKRLSTDFYMVTEEDLSNFCNAFIDWFEKLKLREPVYIFINDLNLLEKERSFFLSWLPLSSPENIHIVCSVNSEDMLTNARALGWNCMEMPLFPEDHAERYLQSYLYIYGKTLSSEQTSKLILAPAARYPGYLRLIADFLIDCGSFDNIDTLIDGLVAANDITETYHYIFNQTTKPLTSGVRKGVRMMLGILYRAQMSLTEQECYTLTHRLTGITAIEWATAGRVFEEFGLIQGDYWNMRSKSLRRFTKELLTVEELRTIDKLLGDQMMDQLHRKNDQASALQRIRENTAYSKAALNHYCHSQCWNKLITALTDRNVLYYLTKLDWHVARAAWMTLVLQTETDVPRLLLDQLEKYRDNLKHEFLAAECVAGLFTDLEFRTYVDQARSILDLDHTPGSLQLFFQSFSDRFISYHNHLSRLNNSGSYQKLYTEATKHLSSATHYKPIEKCQLLFYKANAERELHRMEDALETINVYYAEALRAASDYDVRRALTMRGEALYMAGQYHEAAENQREACRLALQYGDMRAYLSAQNILGMCKYREGRFDEAIGIFDRLAILWNRVRNEKEVAAVRLNKCNALYLKNDHEGALRTAQEAYDRIKNLDDDTLGHIRTSLLGNMGTYTTTLNRYEEAETYLLQAIQNARSLHSEGTLVNAMHQLAAVYQKSGRPMLAVDLLRELMELHWERKDHQLLINTVLDAETILLTHHYYIQAEELRTSWEERFSALPGGKQLFDRKFSNNKPDSLSIELLRQKLVLARSADDPLMIAKASSSLAHALADTNPVEAAELQLRAAEACKQQGAAKECSNHLCTALHLLFCKGTLRSVPLFDKVIRVMTDPVEKRIAMLWKQFSDQPQNKSKGLLTGILRILSPREKKLSNAQTLLEISSHARTHPDLVNACLDDLSDILIASCSAREIMDIIHTLPRSHAESLSNKIAYSMLRTCNQDTGKLVCKPTGSEADALLASYEKYTQVLSGLDHEGAASVAGNIATIFRRREEQEKCFRYHGISMDYYKKAGKMRDYLIELLNLSTAYHEFSKEDQAISLLRQGMKESAEAGEESLLASFAGNLASFLFQNGHTDAHEEILSCFRTEESFFRKSGSQRDLAISLTNQIRYQLTLEDPDMADLSSKLSEAEELARQYRLQQFIPVLEQLRWEFSTRFDTAASPHFADAAVRLQQFLEKAGGYRSEHVSQEGSMLHAVCVPFENSPTGKELLHLFLPLDDETRLDMVFLCQPLLIANEAGNMEAYIQWWNHQGQYQLTLHREARVLQADFHLFADHPDGLVSQFDRCHKLFSADEIVMQMVYLGMDELRMHQDMKMKHLCQEQETGNILNPE